MNIYFESTTLNWSEGISLTPVSLFIDLSDSSGKSVDSIYNLFDDIKEKHLNDITFTGDTYSNRKALRWLTPRLIADGVLVNIVAEIAPNIVKSVLNIVASRYIYVVNKANYKLAITLQTRDIDIVKIDTKTIKELAALYSICLKSDLHNAIFMFNSDKIDKQEVLEWKSLHNMYPCSSI
jgi:hypothetical protein